MPEFNYGTAAKKLQSIPAKRTEEELLKKSAGKTIAGKAANVAGKALGVGSLMLNSAPTVAEKKPVSTGKFAQGYEELQKLQAEKNQPSKLLEGIKPPAYTQPKKENVIKITPKKAEPKKTEVEPVKPATVSNPDVDSPTYGDVSYTVNVGGAEVKLNYDIDSDKLYMMENGEKKPIPDSSSLRDTIPANLTKESLKAKGKEMEKEKSENNMTPDLELPAEKKEETKTAEKAAETKSEEATETKEKPDYHNIISYYRTGGFGDPKSGKAKYNLGMAILDQLGKTASQIGNIAMANAGKAGVANTTTQFDAEQAQARDQAFNFENKDKEQELTFERMQKELANNKELQKSMNELQKDFQEWTDKHAVEFMSGKKYEDMTTAELEEAFKKYVSAKGNQLESGGVLDTIMKGLGIAGGMTSNLLPIFYLFKGIKK